MDKIAITKKIVNAAVGFSTSFVISNLVRQNVHADSKLKTIELEVGGFVLGYIVADHAQKYAVAKVDEVVDWYNDTVKPKLHK